MKNNRSIHVDKEFQQKHQISTDPPPPDSLFWKMWNANKSTASEALNTDFIQGIKAGTLDPVKYGSFNVSDAYYCFHGAEDYAAAESKATDPTLKAFLLKKYNGYKKYNDTFPTVWHLKDANGIVPSEVCKQYSDFESNVALMEDPIYTLVGMVPCEYLWAWLGTQLSPPSEGNLYASWITSNDYPDGAYAMGNFIDQYQHEHGIDEQKATDLYSQAMNFEFLNFKTATE